MNFRTRLGGDLWLVVGDDQSKRISGPDRPETSDLWWRSVERISGPDRTCFHKDLASYSWEILTVYSGSCSWPNFWTAFGFPDQTWIIFAFKVRTRTRTCPPWTLVSASDTQPFKPFTCILATLKSSGCSCFFLNPPKGCKIGYKIAIIKNYKVPANTTEESGGRESYSSFYAENATLFK